MIRAAAEERQYNIAEDLRMLQQQHKKQSAKDYIRLLDTLLAKYTVTEQATVHAALVARCRAGDAAAIKLYFELQTGTGGNAQEVTIVDDV